MQTGTIVRFPDFPEPTYCFIATDDGEIFARKLEFVNPAEMELGKLVRFRVKQVQHGPRPEATDIQAA